MSKKKHTFWERNQLSTDQTDGWPQRTVDRVNAQLGRYLVDQDGVEIMRFDPNHPTYEQNIELTLKAANCHDELVAACHSVAVGLCHIVKRDRPDWLLAVDAVLANAEEK